MPDVITRDQLKELIKSENIRPSELFGSETLTEDPVVRGYTEAEIKRATAGEYAHRKRDEEGSLKLKGELEKQLKEREGEVQKLKIEVAKSQLGTLFEKQKADRNLDERQVKFIQNRIAKFTPTKAEDLEKEFSAHLDTEIDEYKRLAKDVFGVDSEKEGDGKGKAVGGEPVENKGATPKDKYVNPLTNPFIKTD